MEADSPEVEAEVAVEAVGKIRFLLPEKCNEFKIWSLKGTNPIVQTYEILSAFVGSDVLYSHCQCSNQLPFAGSK